MPPRTLLSWSSGKDCAWALHKLRHGACDLAAISTSFDTTSKRVAMHGVRDGLVDAQARALGLPLWRVELPWSCPNPIYEERMRELLARAEAAGIEHIAFADLFLEDIRAYRESKMAAHPKLKLQFPLWRRDTDRLAREMLDGGLKAVLVTGDPKRLPLEFAGREFDRDLLNDLPAGVDPCGENGEFHTFCYALPEFSEPVKFTRGTVQELGGFWYQDLLPA